MKMLESTVTVKDFLEMIDEKHFSFDFIDKNKQSNDADRDSLIVYSMIVGHCITPSYFIKKENGVYYSSDETQNILVISKYINNDFPLSKGTSYVHDEQCKTIEISEKYFRELSEEFQERILNYNLTIYSLEGVTVNNKDLAMLLISVYFKNGINNKIYEG